MCVHLCVFVYVYPKLVYIIFFFLVCRFHIPAMLSGRRQLLEPSTFLTYTNVSDFLRYYIDMLVHSSVWGNVSIGMHFHLCIPVHSSAKRPTVCLCRCWFWKSLEAQISVSAVDTSVMFLKTMIVSCLAPTTQPPKKNWAFTFIYVLVCRELHAHLCCLLVYKEKLTLICLLIVLQGFPSFTYDYGKIPQPLTTATKHRTLLELYSVCVIRQKTGNKAMHVNLLWDFAKVSPQT